MKIDNPYLKVINDNEKELKKLENKINSCKDKKEQRIISEYPTVYVHAWTNKNGEYETYVGESNNIFNRTREHYIESKDKKKWQYNLKSKNAKLYIIGHKHFNKSLTMDIENKLMHYLTGVEKVTKVHNSRSNPQNKYYTSKEFDGIFEKIWINLRKYDKNIFPSEEVIKDSAIFKSSPLHKLTKKQQNIKQFILSKVEETLLTKKRQQIIFIEGDTGSGKTVLNSSIFYELCMMSQVTIDNQPNPNYKNLNCCLIINQNKQEKVYNEIFKKLCIYNDGKIISKATTFINKYSTKNPVDVAFIDEAHLLLTQGHRSYTGKNQLNDIIKRAKVTVILFDRLQVLETKQYWELEVLNKYIKMAKKQKTYIQLDEQFRIQCNKQVLKWIDSFTKEGKVNKIPKNTGKYEIKIFDTPELLEKAIKKKANNKKTKLSRLVATYDWEYKKYDKNKDYYVKIGKWKRLWNYETEKRFDKEQKKKISNLSWTEQEHTISEVGSTFTIQGFDLNYVGVIIGKSVTYKNNKIDFRPEKCKYSGITNNRTFSNNVPKNVAKELLKNQLRVLMTRGINGLYIYIQDEKLKEHLKKCAGKKYYFK